MYKTHTFDLEEVMVDNFTLNLFWRGRFLNLNPHVTLGRSNLSSHQNLTSNSQSMIGFMENGKTKQKV